MHKSKHLPVSWELSRSLVTTYLQLSTILFNFLTTRTISIVLVVSRLACYSYFLFLFPLRWLFIQVSSRCWPTGQQDWLYSSCLLHFAEISSLLLLWPWVGRNPDLTRLLKNYLRICQARDIRLSWQLIVSSHLLQSFKASKLPAVGNMSFHPLPEFPTSTHQHINISTYQRL